MWDSDPRAEIEESWVKAQPLLAAVGSRLPELVATVRILALAVGGRGLVDPDEPVLHADDEAFLRGRAAFETIRVYGGRPFRLDEHLRRLAGSAGRLDLGDVDVEEFESLARAAIDRAAQRRTPCCASTCTAGREGGGSPVSLALVSEIPSGLEEHAVPAA